MNRVLAITALGVLAFAAYVYHEPALAYYDALRAKYATPQLPPPHQDQVVTVVGTGDPLPEPQPVPGTVNKCKVNGKTVYTDQTCASIGGKGGALTGGNVVVTDQLASDGQILAMKVEQANKTRQQTSEAPAVNSMEDKRRRTYAECSKLEERRIEALRLSQREYADQINDYMKRYGC